MPTCVNEGDLRQIIVFEQAHMYSQSYNTTVQSQQSHQQILQLRLEKMKRCYQPSTHYYYINLKTYTRALHRSCR